jgi:hypothetical protein
MHHLATMIELFVVLAVTTAVIGLAGSLPDRRRVKRLLGSARVQSVETLSDGGRAVVRGEVIAGDLIEAPLTKRDCVYWLVTFDEVGTGGDFRELGSAERGEPFVLRDPTGDARVVPQNPRVAVPPVETMRSFAAMAEVKGPVASMLAKCKKPNYPHSSVLRITEYAVLPGALVTVMGFCTFEPNPNAAKDVTGYRTALPTRPVISGSRRRPLLIG